MTEVSFPTNTVTLSGAQVTVALQAQKILVVSQMSAAGTAVDGALNENIQTNANDLAGITSMGAAVVRAVRAVNPDTQVDAIFVDDNGSGAAATGAQVVAGTATEAGELLFTFGSARNNTVSVAVADTDTASVVGDTLVAAMVANGIMPVTGINTAGSVALTAVNDGTEGNSIPVSVSGSVAGLTVTLNAMSGGATDPTLTGVFDVINDTRYQTILWSWSNSLTELTNFVDGRFNTTDDVLDGMGHVAKVDTLSNHLSAVGALNSFLNYTVAKLEISTATLKGNDLGELPWVISAYVGALRARKLTEGSAIASLNVGVQGADSIGGPALASRPLANTPITPLIPSSASLGWTKLDISSLEAVGASIMGNNSAGNTVILGQQLLTRTTDAGGNPDDSFKFVNFFDTSTGVREYYDANLRSRYAQTRLTDGSPVETRPMVNERIFKATLTEYYTDLAGSDFALTRSGETALQFFNTNVTASADLQTGTMTWTAKVPITTQLRIMNGSIEIAFDIIEISDTLTF
jgi:phage tail sheath gpL-like